MNIIFRGRASSLALAIAAVTAAAPASAADLSGRVVDSLTGASLPGAIVSAGNRSVTADNDGVFVLRDIAPGPVEIEIRYIGYPVATRSAVASDAPTVTDFTLDPPEGTGAGADIVVTGTRAAERRALQAKKASDVVQETLNANDVGKLPDQNVAEAIRRLPGLSVADDQGEGRYVVVRGGDPDLTNVTLNGQTAAAPEPEGRQVKLDDIPSSLIGSVTVSKTLTADRDANAISGQVDINTLTAYDRNKAFAYARAAIGLNDLNDRNPYEGDLTVGSTFGGDRQFGAVLSGNYSKRPIESENVQFGPRTGALNLPNDFRIRDYNLTRTRYGMVGNFDYRPSTDVQLFLRTLYSVFKDSEIRDQLRIEVPTAAAVGTAAGSTATSPTTGSFQRARGTRFVRSRTEDDNTLTVQGGGKFNLGAGELTAEGTYSKAVKKDPLRSEFQFRSGTGVAGSTTAGLFGTYSGLDQDLPTFTPNDASYNPALFPSRQVNYDRRRAEEKLYQGRVDLKLPFAGSDDSYFKIGAKFLQRDKTNDRAVEVYTLSGFTAAVASSNDNIFIYEGQYRFGPRTLYDQAQAFATANPSSRTLDAAGSLSASTVADYDVDEKIYAGYAMGSFRFDKLTLIPGVRIERTEGRYTAKTLVPTSATIATLIRGADSTVRNSYTDVFPGLNAKYDATDRLVLRAAATTAIGRPNYADLAPTIQVDPAAATVVLGNATLKPYKAVNGDVSIEYYLPGQGILSLAGFYKDIDSPVYTAIRTGVTGAFAGVTFTGTGATVTQPVNANHETIYGVEVNLQSQLTFLPAPFDGLGIGANYAYIDGDTSGIPGRTGAAPPFFQSKHVATAQLFYEKGRVAMRAAYSYRSHYLEAIGANPTQDTYIEDHGQLDVRASFALRPEATLFVEGSNLTDAALRRYLGTSAQVIENERYSYSVRAGVQLAF